MYVRARVYCVCACVYMHVYMCVCGGQGPILGVPSQESPTFSSVVFSGHVCIVNVFVSCFFCVWVHIHVDMEA